MYLCVLGLPKTHINISWKEVQFAQVTISSFLPRLIWLAAYRPVRVVIVRPNIHPIMHLVSRFLLKFLNPTPKALIVFLICPNHPIAVRIKIRRALIWPELQAWASSKFDLKTGSKNHASWLVLHYSANSSGASTIVSPKGLFLRKQQIFEMMAKYFWFHLLIW